MPETVRRSLVREYVSISAGHHRRYVRHQRELTSQMASRIVEEEDWAPGWKSYLSSLVTVGLHLPVEYRIRQKWHQQKLDRIGSNLCFKIMDAYIANISQEEGMIPTIACYIGPTLQRHGATYVSNELEKAVDLDDRLSGDELEYFVAMVHILKDLVKDGTAVTKSSIANQARKYLVKMAEENTTIEFSSGGGLRQVEYREEHSCLCVRNIESSEVTVVEEEELQRDSVKSVHAISGGVEGFCLGSVGLSSRKEVYSLKGKRVLTMKSKEVVKGEWAPVRSLTEIDGSNVEASCRAWYLILNHSMPNRFTVHPGPHAWAFRPSDSGFTSPHSILADKEISVSEMKCSPLKLVSSEDENRKTVIHPKGTKLSCNRQGLTVLRWDGIIPVDSMFK